MLTRQSRKTDSAFYEDEYGLLRRRHPTINEVDQIVLPETLRPRVLDLAHYSKLAGHPGQTRMYHHVRSTYYWPQMATDIYRTVQICNACARNRVKLRKRTHPLRLFPAQRPLESLSIDILGPLTKTALTYAYNNHVHRPTGTTPFSLVLSRPPPEFSLHHSIRSRARPTQEQRNDYVKRLDDSIQHAHTRLLATQARYKRDFDKGIRTIRQRIKRGDYVFLDPTGGQSKTGKLRSPAIGPYRVLRKDDRTYVIDRDGATERINAD